MLTSETKRHIDSARQILVGVVPNPISQIDQITNALIYKFMDDMDQNAIKMGGAASFFTKDLEKYAWTRLMDTRLGNQERMNLYAEALPKFSIAEQLPQLFRDIFKSAFLPFHNPEALGLFLREIDYFDYKHSEELGNAYEYLLQIMGSQGDAGQFRTPRHIIDFIVEAVNPTKDEKILDPACGTAGFLISAYSHILKQHDGKDDPEHKEKPLTPDERRKLMDGIEGYDIDPTMVRMAQVNMYLHQFKNPKIAKYDSLSMDERWNDKFDVILANPPFMSPKGGIKPHSKFSVQSTRSEVLFVDYIMNHLKPGGRAGIIVPEGIIFQSGKAYKELRKNLVNGGLYAVVSLPSGVFNPYSGVKTSILLLDNELAKKRDEILFIKIDNDGFDLGAQRRPIAKNDLPGAIATLEKWHNGTDIDSTNASTASKIVIVESDDCSLSGDRHRNNTNHANAKWNIVEIGEISEVIAGQSPPGEYYNETGDGVPFYQGKTEFSDKYISSPTKWTTQVTKIAEKNDILMSVRAPVGPVNLASQRICIGRGLAAIRPSSAEFLYVFYILKEMQDRIKGNGGAVFDSINKAQIEKLKIPLPPLEIQKQIVAELDGYQAIINGAKQIVENWKPRIEIDPGWEKVELYKIAEINKSTVNTISNKEYLYIDISSVENGTGLLRDSEPIMGIHLPTRAKRGVRNDDVLISTVRPTLKAFTHLRNPPENSVASTGFAVLSPTIKTLGGWIYYSVLQDVVINQMEAKMGKGAYPSINSEDVKKLIIPLPPLEIQKQIVEKIEAERALVESSKKLIEIYEQKSKAVIEKLWKE